MTRRTHRRMAVVGFAALSFAGTVRVVPAAAPRPSTDPLGTETAGPAGPLCAALPADGEGSVSGMADDPVATAARNNSLLSTLSAAVMAAGLRDTLNGEGPFTVFAPVNSAFDKIDRATLQAVAADTEALVEILTYHVVAERVSSADLVAGGTFATVNGAELTVAMVGETLVINGGAAAVQCAEVPTANATVYLIDTLLMTPTTSEAATTTTVPAVTTTAPAVSTTAPAGQNIPGQTTVRTTVPVEQTTVPVEQTTEPEVQTTVPEVPTTVPEVQTTVPVVTILPTLPTLPTLPP